MPHRWGTLIICLFLASCTPAPLSIEATATPTASEEVSIPALTPLQLRGDGETFLAHIEEVTGPLNEPQAHRFLEIQAESGLWQGESFTYPDRWLALLQAAQSGGAAAVQIEDTTAPDPDTLRALLASQPADALESPFPVIRFVRARFQGDALWSFDVTLEYPDKGWDDYADGWHVATVDAEVLGTRILLHPHVNEQPFTRSLTHVSVPPEIDQVVIRSHDLVSGYSPETVLVPLAEAGSTSQYEVVR